MNFIDFTETDIGASGQILRLLKQIHDYIRAFGFTKMSMQPETNLRCLFCDTDMNPLISMETNVTMEILPFHLER